MATVESIGLMRPISADSHVLEPPTLWAEFIDPAYRDACPHLVHDPDRGDIYTVPNMAGGTFRLGGAFGAGRSLAETSRPGGWRFDEIYPGAWNPAARMADMDRDGIAAEVIYPTAGMIIMAHEDRDYQHACLTAYSRWLEGFVGGSDRLFGVSPTAARTAQELLAHVDDAKARGFKGVMLPETPGEADYDSAIYDPVWEAAADLDLPLCFHILPGSAGTGLRGQPRGGRLNAFTSVIRGNQDIIGVFIFGGVFQRHPKLKLICVEADAGWAPHYMYRMDGAYDRHRQQLSDGALERKPSEYFLENVYMTFQDDGVAMRSTHLLNPERLLWATDFPHTDSTWPHSCRTMAEMAEGLDETIVRMIVRDNTAKVYGLPVN